MTDLRQTFWDEMKKLAEADKDVIVLTGDLGYSFMEDFALSYPEQFYNMGIAEQNAVGVAAGLARVGKKPYVYSGSLFLASRAHEFIRDDVAYNNTNVKLIGTGASGFLGFTHNMSDEEDEDSWFNGIPNIEIKYPIGEIALANFLKQEGPKFIRL